MSMTFSEAVQPTRSEKITLVTMRAESRSKIFTVHSGSIYYKDVNYFVSSIKNSGTALTEVSSLASVVAGSFYYSITTKRVYFRLSDSSNPLNGDVSIVYKLFFSNAPLILPHNLTTGEQIEWLPYIESVGSIGQKLDEESTGVILESQSNITMINSEGFFDEIFDTLIWENKQVEFYSWLPLTPITQAQKIFDGVVESKDYSSSSVSFGVKDFVYRLRDFVNLPLFTSYDGKLTPSLLDTPKRRIYGQVKQLRCPCLDNKLNGITLTGMASISAESTTLNGFGTSFLTQLAPGDEIIMMSGEDEYKLGVESVISNTEATINNAPELNLITQTVVNNPGREYRTTNRRWHVSGHKLREVTCEILDVISNNRFQVDSVQDIFPNDRLLINGDLVSVRRISGDVIVTKSAVSPTPSNGDTLKKLPIQNVYFGKKELIYERDWDYTNTTQCIIDIDPLAEFNIAQQRLVGVNLTFTNLSRTITTSSTIDLRTLIGPNDWVKKNTIVSGQGDWYEVLSVKEQEITLRTAYTGSTATTTALYKAIDHINDSSLITVNCLGMEVSGSWMKTPSDTVRHLLLNDAGFASVNEPSFSDAKSDCDYILSVIIQSHLSQSRQQ